MKVRRWRWTRTLGIVLALLIPGALWTGAQSLVHAPYLSLRKVQVTGAGEPGALLQAAGLHMGMPLWTTNLSSARARLLRHAPWFSSASLVRIFPDELRITVVRRRPIALVTSPTGRLFGVDRSGVVLPVATKDESAYPYLVGLSPPVKAYAHLRGSKEALGLLVLLPSPLRERVSEVAVTGGAVDLYLLNGTEVMMGTGTNLRLKIEVLSAILKDARAKGVRIIRIDLRHPDSPTVTTPP